MRGNFHTSNNAHYYHRRAALGCFKFNVNALMKFPQTISCDSARSTFFITVKEEATRFHLGQSTHRILRREWFCNIWCAWGQNNLKHRSEFLSESVTLVKSNRVVIVNLKFLNLNANFKNVDFLLLFYQTITTLDDKTGRCCLVRCFRARIHFKLRQKNLTREWVEKMKSAHDNELSKMLSIKPCATLCTAKKI